MEQSDNLDEFLNKWDKCKQELAILTKRSESYKQKIISIMDKEKVNTLKSKNYLVSRKKHFRETISKKNIPSNIWSQYSNVSKYDVVSLTYK